MDARGREVEQEREKLGTDEKDRSYRNPNEREDKIEREKTLEKVS